MLRDRLLLSGARNSEQPCRRNQPNTRTDPPNTSSVNVLKAQLLLNYLSDLSTRKALVLKDRQLIMSQALYILKYGLSQ